MTAQFSSSDALALTWLPLLNVMQDAVGARLCLNDSDTCILIAAYRLTKRMLDLERDLLTRLRFVTSILLTSWLN